MRFNSRKFLLLLLISAISVFFGVDIATSGLERVRGPVNGPAWNATAPAPLPAKPPPAPAAAVQPPPVAPVMQPTAQERAFVNHFALKLGEALRICAQTVIRWTASLFNAILY